MPDLCDPSRTALLVIDVQEDFVSPTGAAAGWGIDLGALATPLARIEQLLAAARAKGVAVIFSRVVTRPETDSAALKEFHRRRGHPPQSLDLCRADTSGADYYRVAPQAGEIEVAKLLYSCFAGTDLDGILRARGIDSLVVCGFTTDCCVDCTVRDAFHRNFLTLVVEDACAAYDRELHRGALAGLAANCALLTDSAAVIEAWR